MCPNPENLKTVFYDCLESRGLSILGFKMIFTKLEKPWTLVSSSRGIRPAATLTGKIAFPHRKQATRAARLVADTCAAVYHGLFSRPPERYFPSTAPKIDLAISRDTTKHTLVTRLTRPIQPQKPCAKRNLQRKLHEHPNKNGNTPY